MKDILHQIAWFKSQKMLKDEIDGESVLDKRYIVPMPERGDTARFRSQSRAIVPI